MFGMQKNATSPPVRRRGRVLHVLVISECSRRQKRLSGTFSPPDLNGIDEQPPMMAMLLTGSEWNKQRCVLVEL